MVCLGGYYSRARPSKLGAVTGLVRFGFRLGERAVDWLGGGMVASLPSIRLE